VISYILLLMFARHVYANNMQSCLSVRCITMDLCTLGKAR